MDEIALSKGGMYSRYITCEWVQCDRCFTIHYCRIQGTLHASGFNAIGASQFTTVVYKVRAE